VSEAITENLAAKKTLFEALDGACKPDAIFALEHLEPPITG